jgi:membrane protein required for colicin V production
MHLNWLDFVLIAILLASTIVSARKGFSREIVGLAASLFAFVLAMWFYGLAGSFIAPYTHSPRVANLIGFILVVLAVLVCGGILGWIVNRFLRTIGLSFLDRMLGAAFGLARGALIAMAVLTAFIAFGSYAESHSEPGAVVNSQIAPYILQASRWFVAIAPMELKSSFRKEYAQVEAALRKNVSLPPKPEDSRQP